MGFIDIEGARAQESLGRFVVIASNQQNCHPSRCKDSHRGSFRLYLMDHSTHLYGYAISIALSLVVLRVRPHLAPFPDDTK